MNTTSLYHADRHDEPHDIAHAKDVIVSVLARDLADFIKAAHDIPDLEENTRAHIAHIREACAALGFDWHAIAGRTRMNSVIPFALEMEWLD